MDFSAVATVPAPTADLERGGLVVDALVNALRHSGGGATASELREIIAQDYPWRRDASARRIALGVLLGVAARRLDCARRDDGELLVWVVDSEAAVA
jgi:hypothetical protein